MTETVRSSGRGGTAAAMAQNEQTSEEYSTLEHAAVTVKARSPSVVRLVEVCCERLLSAGSANFIPLVFH